MRPVADIRAPAPLRACPAWLCWKYEQFPDEDKPRKVPYWANGKRRSGQQGGDRDRSLLVTFDEAQRAAIRLGMDGVGFAPLKGLGVVALDFDNCFDDGVLDPEVAQIARRSYAEKSPSGNGVRVFLTGDVGNHKNKPLFGFGFETFSTNGFVTVTGDILPECEILGFEDTLSPVDAPVQALIKERFEDRDRPEFDADDPFAGTAPRSLLTLDEIREAVDKLDPNMSRTEGWLTVGMALHHQLEGSEEAFQMWNVWSMGGESYPGEERLRDDWASFDRREGSRRPIVTMRSVFQLVKDLSVEEVLRRLPSINEPATAIAAVLGAALTTPADYTGPYAVVSPETMMHQPQMPSYIKGLLPKGSLSMMFGDSTSGKSFLALDIACAIARGVPWHGHKVRQGRVIYVVAEGAGSFGKRIHAYCHDRRVDGAVVATHLGMISAAPNMLDPENVAELIKAIRAAGGADLIILDTWAQVTAGANENDGQDMGKAIKHANIVRQLAGCDVLLIHHPGKDLSRGARGWSGQRAAVDCEIEVSQDINGNRLARVTKMKDGDVTFRFNFKLAVIHLGEDEDGQPITSCVIEPIAPPVVENTIIAKGVKSRDKWQHHVVEMLQTVDPSLASMAVEDLVTLCADALTAPTEGRDVRRQEVMRAIDLLAKEKGAPLALKGGRVIFYA